MSDGMTDTYAQKKRMEKEAEEKEAKFLELITVLNKKKLQGFDGLFDCDELGIAHINWHHGWKVRWFELIKDVNKL